MEGGSGYKIVGETFYEHEKCDLQEISFLQVPDPWLAIQKNSSYKEMLKIGLRQIQESGLQEREVSRIYTKKLQCHGTGSSFVSVSMIDVYSAIVIFIAGIISSLTLFIAELFIYKQLRKHILQ
ncbi:Ionotropic receptor 75d [Carabus blaptoides fortunei]